jgi:hypothetical protein
MAPELEKEEILKRLLEAACERWGEETVGSLRPGLELAAETVWKVELFKLDPEEEPAHPTMLLQYGAGRREKRIEEE